jgi:50S ribosomal subunit-associated GTPase HflX
MLDKMDDQTTSLVDSRTYFVINKIDCVSGTGQLALNRQKFPGAWEVSLKEGTGVEELASRLRAVVEKE